MDLGLLYGCVVTLCLLSPAHCPDRECPCKEIPTFEAGQIGPLIGDCHQLEMALRYTCKDGYVRKAGSSNLLKCQDDTKQWKIPNLTCIPDPNRSHTKTTIPPSKTTPEPSVATTTSVPPSKTTPEPSVATTTSVPPSKTTPEPSVATTTSVPPSKTTPEPSVATTTSVPPSKTTPEPSVATTTSVPPSKTTPEPSVATTTSVPPSKTTPEPSVATTTSAGTSSTARPPADNNTPSASKSASSAATVAIVSGAALVIVAVGVGGVVLWYRRRAIDVVSGEEVIPMNTPA